MPLENAYFQSGHKNQCLFLKSCLSLLHVFTININFKNDFEVDCISLTKSCTCQ